MPSPGPAAPPVQGFRDARRETSEFPVNVSAVLECREELSKLPRRVARCLAFGLASGAALEPVTCRVIALVVACREVVRRGRKILKTGLAFPRKRGSGNGARSLGPLTLLLLTEPRR